MLKTVIHLKDLIHRFNARWVTWGGESILLVFWDQGYTFTHAASTSHEPCSDTNCDNDFMYWRAIYSLVSFPDPNNPHAEAIHTEVVGSRNDCFYAPLIWLGVGLRLVHIRPVQALVFLETFLWRHTPLSILYKVAQTRLPTPVIYGLFYNSFYAIF